MHVHSVWLTHVVIPLDEKRAISSSKLIPPMPITSIMSAGLFSVLWGVWQVWGGVYTDVCYFKSIEYWITDYSIDYYYWDMRVYMYVMYMTENRISCPGWISRSTAVYICEHRLSWSATWMEYSYSYMSRLTRREVHRCRWQTPWWHCWQSTPTPERHKAQINIHVHDWPIVTTWMNTTLRYRHTILAAGSLAEGQCTCTCLTW